MSNQVGELRKAEFPPRRAMPPLDLFLSFHDTPEDRAFAEQVAQALEERGVTTFLSARDMDGGLWVRQVDDHLERARWVAVVVSPAYLASDSPWVAAERSRGDLIPLLRGVEVEELPATLRAFQAVDFSQPERFEAAVDRLAGIAARAPARTPSPPVRETTRGARRPLVVAGLIAALAVAVAAAVWLAADRRPAELGWWEVEAELVGDAGPVAPGEPLALQVRSDHDGFLWIYSPTDGRPNRVFPCPPTDPDCARIVAAAPHTITAGSWRPVPRRAPPPADPYGVTAGTAPGPDELVILVTGTNDPTRALAHLAAMRPELRVKANPARVGEWGAAVLRVEVEDGR